MLYHHKMEKSMVSGLTNMEVKIPHSDVLLKFNISGKTFIMPESKILYRQIGLLYDFVKASHEERLKICDDYFEKSGAYYFARPAHLVKPIFSVS